MKPDLDLAVVGNCVVASLVDRRARHAWFCWPRLDGDPVFCSLLDGEAPDAGFWDIEVDDVAATEQAYLDHSAVLTTIVTDRAGGRLRIVDFAPRYRRFERIARPPALYRRLEPLAGTPRLRVRVRPRFGYGAETAQARWSSNSVRYVAGDRALRLTTDAPLAYVAEEARFALLRPLHFVLGPDEPFAGSLATTWGEHLDETLGYWAEWTRYLSVPFEWQRAVLRAAVTLKLCSYEETGAIVAALTTSVPEAPDSARNWDYRFCWLRDAYFVVHALNRLGATRTMENYLSYIDNLVALEPSGALKPLYPIVPGIGGPEREIDSLAGYRGMGPVRVGNGADAQVQNDAYGSVILAAAQTFFDQRLPRMGDGAMFARLERIGERAAAAALEPDAGPWEYRGRRRVHTYSAVVSWAACRRLAKIAASLGLAGRESRWRAEALRLRRTILAGAWNAERGTFAESFGGSEVDGSLLLLHQLGFLSGRDPRFLATLEAIGRSLRRGNYLMRYAGADDFGVPTTAFTVCGFWYVDALAAAGRRGEARALFEALLARRTRLGLLSEDLDPTTGELWGNFPQTYSMVGLIHSAMRLSKSWDEGLWRVS